AARRAASDLHHVANLLRPKWPGWKLDVLLASAVTGEGVPEVWATITGAHRTLIDAGELERLRARQNVAWMWSEITADLVDALRRTSAVASASGDIEAQVAEGARSPTSAASELLAVFGETGFPS